MPEPKDIPSLLYMGEYKIPYLKPQMLMLILVMVSLKDMLVMSLVVL